MITMGEALKVVILGVTFAWTYKKLRHPKPRFLEIERIVKLR